MQVCQWEKIKGNDEITSIALPSRRFYTALPWPSSWGRKQRSTWSSDPAPATQRKREASLPLSKAVGKRCRRRQRRRMNHRWFWGWECSPEAYPQPPWSGANRAEPWLWAPALGPAWEKSREPHLEGWEPKQSPSDLASQ